MPSEIPFIRPTFPDPSMVAAEYEEIVRSNWFTNFGPKERRFTQALAEYIGNECAVATFANGSLALLAAIHSSTGYGSRDKYLLMPSFTFAAVAESAIWLGYRPWFIDIDPHTWQPSLPAAQEILESHRDEVAGILLTNAFGVGNPQIDDWEACAAEWDLPIVIDSAAGFGSAYTDGTKLGTRGTCEIFSFHATKPFAVGEGGALASRDAKLVDHARDFTNFGFAPKSRECATLGLNAKMAEMSSAIGLRQLIDFDQRLASRREVFSAYKRELADLDLQFQPNAEVSSLCFASIVCSSAIQKASMLASLQAFAVQARDYYNPPQHCHPYFQANPELTREADLSVTADICSRIISVPIHDHMDPADVARVVEAITSYRHL